MEFILHFIMVYRSKKSDDFKVKDFTITGGSSSALEKMKSVIEIEAKSNANEWDLISVSHAFIPFKCAFYA